jgi:hypothetical protein
MDSQLFTQKVSKINGKLKKLLGDTLSKKYKIINQKGEYSIEFNKRFVIIERYKQ